MLILPIAILIFKFHCSTLILQFLLYSIYSTSFNYQHSFKKINFTNFNFKFPLCKVHANSIYNCHYNVHSMMFVVYFIYLHLFIHLFTIFTVKCSFYNLLHNFIYLHATLYFLHSTFIPSIFYFYNSQTTIINAKFSRLFLFNVRFLFDNSFILIEKRLNYN